MLIDFYILGVWIMLGICLGEDSKNNNWLDFVLVSLFSWVGIGRLIGEFLKKFDKN